LQAKNANQNDVSVRNGSMNFIIITSSIVIHFGYTGNLIVFPNYLKLSFGITSFYNFSIHSLTIIDSCIYLCLSCYCCH